MSDTKKTTPIEMVALSLFVIGSILIFASAIFRSFSYFQELSLLGFILALGSFYFVYKLIEKKSKDKQKLGGLLISIVVVYFFFTANSLKFVQELEENSIATRFSIMRGEKGKGQLASDTGYIEKVIEIPNARKDIRIIGIKTETLEKLQGTWPIHWSKYAQVIEAFKGTNNTLLFDIFFVDYKKGEQEQMESALKGSNNVLFDYSIESTSESRSSVKNLENRINMLRRFQLKNVIDPDERGIDWLNFTVPPIEQVTENSAGVGFANIRKEDNTSNRRMPLLAKLEGHGPNKETEFYPSIDLIAACHFLGVDVVKDTEVVMGEYVKIKNIPLKKIKNSVGEEVDIMSNPNPERTITIPIDIYGQIQINFAGSLYSFRDDDIYDVAEWGKDFAANYQNTIFLVAMFYATGRGASKDTHLSPYGEMSGIEHHAHAINTILNQKFLSSSSEFTNLLIMILLGLGFAFVQSRIKTYTSLLLFFGTITVYYFVSLYLFSYFDYLVPVPTVQGSILFIFISIIAFKILTEEENVKYIRNTFSKFVSKDVVDELLKNPEMIALGGARREITIFFSDIRGFTTMSEALGPEDLVKLLNEYLSTMTEIIIQYKGTIDKYMGDAIMAFWGAPVNLEDHAYYSCVASLVQMKRLKELQEGWKKRKLPSIDIGIGLNSGPAVVGNMGSSQRMEYTVMGDTINLGSRLEGSNKMYGTNIIISEYTYEKVKDRVYARELDLVQVKGKTLPVRIYELMGLVDDTDIETMKRPLHL